MKNKNFWDWKDDEDENQSYNRAESAILDVLSSSQGLSSEDLIKASKLRKQTFLQALRSLREAGAIDRSGKGTRGSCYKYTASTTE